MSAGNENMFGGAAQGSAAALFSSEQDRSVALALVQGLASPSGDSVPEFQQFAQKLKDAGLASEVESWIGRRENICVVPERLEQALAGTRVLDWLAARTRLDPQSVAESLSFILPRIFQEVTPFGRVESADAVLSYLQGLRARLRK